MQAVCTLLVVYSLPVECTLCLLFKLTVVYSDSSMYFECSVL